MLGLGRKEGRIPSLLPTVEQILAKLREAKTAPSNGQSVVRVCRMLGMTAHVINMAAST